MPQFKPTNAHLKIEARNLEQHAKDSQHAWIILGQTEKYAETMEQVRKLRHALTIKGLRARREYLDYNGLSSLFTTIPESTK